MSDEPALTSIVKPRAARWIWGSVIAGVMFWIAVGLIPKYEFL